MSTDLTKPEIQKAIVERVTEAVAPVQGELEGVTEKVDVAKVVAQTIELRNELSIDVPRIVVVPKGEFTSGFAEFDLNVSGINLQPVENEILIQHLHERTQHRLLSGDGIVPEARLEDYLVRGLIDFDDVCYDDHAEMLYKLAGQVVTRLKAYLRDEDEVLNVLQYHQQALVNLIHAQMQEHYEEYATDWEVKVTKGFTTLRQNLYSMRADEDVQDYRTPVADRQRIKQMLFGGFAKSLYPRQKFDSDSERRFAAILENDKDVVKWFKPSKGDFRIYYSNDPEYVPDFAVETKDAKYLCEPKAASEMADSVVLAKAEAAATWCAYASKHEEEQGGKPWTYMLIPHDKITENMTVKGLAAAYTVKPKVLPVVSIARVVQRV